MDPSLSNGGGGDGDGNGVSVSKYSISMNTFLWYFFQSLTVSSMLLMVLSIYWTFSPANNIQVVCVIIVAFAIISPSFIIPKLPTLAAVAIPIIQLNKKYILIRLLNVIVWMYFGYVYPWPCPAIILCYSLMAGVGLLKLYGDIEGPNALEFVSLIGADAAGTSRYMFDYEIKRGTGRWVDSLTGWALLGLFAVAMLAYYLPPLVKPEEKKKMMMNEIEAILTEVAASEKKKKKVDVDVDHLVNVAEAPILGSGTKSLLETAA